MHEIYTKLGVPRGKGFCGNSGVAFDKRVFLTL
jgi:hypothetical protein